jgi:hypothetical protein
LLQATVEQAAKLIGRLAYNRTIKDSVRDAHGITALLKLLQPGQGARLDARLAETVAVSLTVLAVNNELNQDAIRSALSKHLRCWVVFVSACIKGTSHSKSPTRLDEPIVHHAAPCVAFWALRLTGHCVNNSAACCCAIMAGFCMKDAVAMLEAVFGGRIKEYRDRSLEKQCIGRSQCAGTGMGLRPS